MTAAELARLGDELGLDVIGAAPAGAYTDTERHIRERRARGLFADMRFTMAQPETSCHPETLLPGARTVVSAAHCYYAEEPPLQAGEGRLARYTWYDGYAVLRERLDELGRRLGGAYRVLVDANQHVDREAAARAGVGFYGKNTMLITRRYGSWVVLGTLVTEVEIEPTPPLELDCGSCTLCIDACPTGALDEPGTVDATKCLSYWTQAPAAIPAEYRTELGLQAYGCDICQDVCPWNRGIEKRREGQPPPQGATPHVSLVEWLAADGQELVRRYERLYVPRNDPRFLRRNALVALGNAESGDDERRLAEDFAAGEDELLRDHAEWALARMETPRAD
jgi:epoxyqueuosine reductase